MKAFPQKKKQVVQQKKCAENFDGQAILAIPEQKLFHPSTRRA
jgi:hypothetical protein